MRGSMCGAAPSFVDGCAASSSILVDICPSNQNAFISASITSDSFV